jgi:hypothetical protein
MLVFTARFYAAGADVIGIAHTVSGVEPDLREVWIEGEERRYRAVSQLVAEWDAAGALAPGLTSREASDVFWALIGPDVFRLFVVRRRRSQRRFEAWLGSTLGAILLGPSAADG